MTDRYGAEHRAIRRAVAPDVPGSPCSRCGRPILTGQEWDLDHADDRPGYRGVSHARCNRQAGSRLGHQRKRQLAAARKVRRMIQTVALGVQISDDRAHTSIVTAGWLDQHTALVDLVNYVAGPDAVDTLLALRATRTVTAVVLDPRSPSATLLRPLAAAGVAVVELTAVAVATAHGDFLDALRGGRLRHARQPELTAAMRHAAERPLAGATTWAHRGAAVDMSPLAAATWAHFGLTSVTAPVFFAQWR